MLFQVEHLDAENGLLGVHCMLTNKVTSMLYGYLDSDVELSTVTSKNVSRARSYFCIVRQHLL